MRIRHNGSLELNLVEDEVGALDALQAARAHLDPSMGSVSDRSLGALRRMIILDQSREQMPILHREQRRLVANEMPRALASLGIAVAAIDSHRAEFGVSYEKTIDEYRHGNDWQRHVANIADNADSIVSFAARVFELEDEARQIR